MGGFRTAGEVRAGLTEPERALLEVIVGGRLAWSYWSALALAGHAAETAATLEGAGLVAYWSLPDGQALTLTPWGACVLEVWIVERLVVDGEELEEDPFWTDGTRAVPPLRLPKRAREIRYPWPDQIPDPRKPEWLTDEVSEKPVLLFQGPDRADPAPEGPNLAGGIGSVCQRGVQVKIDPKLAAKGKRRRGGEVSEEYLLRTGQPQKRGPKRAG